MKYRFWKDFRKKCNELLAQQVDGDTHCFEATVGVLLFFGEEAERHKEMVKHSKFTEIYLGELEYLGGKLGRIYCCPFIVKAGSTAEGKVRLIELLAFAREVKCFRLTKARNFGYASKEIQKAVSHFQSYVEKDSLRWQLLREAG